MGLEDMLNRIKADAEEQYAKIIADARSEAEKIDADARRRSAEIIAQSAAQTGKELQEERLRSIASVRLESKRKLLVARDAALRKYEEEASRIVDEFPKSSAYKDFLVRVIRDGVSKIGSGAVVRLNSKDRSLVSGNSEEYTISDEPLNSKGGALITSSDGKRRVDNTLESIFDDRKDELKLKLAEQVFGAH
jgi:vacuolar-type H+-ATPase subunit E/Vma4